MASKTGVMVVEVAEQSMYMAVGLAGEHCGGVGVSQHPPHRYQTVRIQNEQKSARVCVDVFLASPAIILLRPDSGQHSDLGGMFHTWPDKGQSAGHQCTKGWRQGMSCQKTFGKRKKETGRFRLRNWS